MTATDLDEALAGTTPEVPTSRSTTTPRKCRRHQWVEQRGHPATDGDGNILALGPVLSEHCRRCFAFRDPVASRRSRNNRKRGNAAELDVARGVGGRKVGPLGHPWDVEVPGYSRLQVKKLATPPSLRTIAGWLAEIARAPGPEMPGVVWIEPGRGGERLIVFRLKDFSERHGVPSERTLEEL